MATENIRILVICRDRDILDTVMRLLRQKAEWVSFGAVTDDDAVRIFDTELPALVLIGSGVGKESEEKLTTYFKLKQPAVKVVQHFGGGSGLLFNEVQQAIEKGH